jgi:hypothetical protein
MRTLVAAAVLLWAAVASAQTFVMVGPISTAMRAEWDVSGPNPASSPAAALLEPRVRVDISTAFIALVGTSCVDRGGMNFTCTAPINQQLADALNVTGSHTLTLRLYDTATMMESNESLPMRILSPAPCLDGTVTYQLGAALGQRNQLSTTNQAIRVAALRRAGFRVESFRAQYKDPSTPTTADGGYWWILATCTGVPQ